MNVASRDPIVLRIFLVAVTLATVCFVLVLPLYVVFSAALSRGWTAYVSAVAAPETMAALQLTLTVAAIAVPLNTLFGFAAAWTTTKFDFPGRTALLALIDLPLAVSPVISGMVFLLLFGLQGWFGEALAAHDMRVAFALPGIVLATLFVTLPFVARELISLMQEQGRDAEEAARLFGAGAWATLWRVTLPRVRWALLSGVLLCNARAMGEFGAVSVVSGHIRGKTNTLPLQVEILFNEYQGTAAFAVATLLATLGLVTLALKYGLERLDAGHARDA